MKKWLVARKAMSAVQCVSIPAWLRLLNEANGPIAGSARESRLITWRDHHTDLIHVCAPDFIDNDAKNRLLLTVAVYQGLQGKRTLTSRRRCNYRLLNFHLNGKSRFYLGRSAIRFRASDK